ncbi:MAG: lytic transglycosylase domain-containing protein [Rhodocyclales bacterium]|nr:lytic transglycosylase domain-containing protein [Rhodocyclales bacterium]MBI5785672.1 lytic transglycosylase domain-containing protein [Rhodocyclales bacterium]
MAAESPIYALTETDGSVILSTVPADDRYALLVGEKPAPVQATVAATGIAVRRTRYNGLIDSVASQYGLQSELLHAVIAVESGYDPYARSRKGAGGLMQLMPGTAKRYGVTDALDPEQNIHGGARYLRDLMRLFNGDLSLVLAAYNAGENAVRRNRNRIPQYRETVEYVPKVLTHYRRNLGRQPGRTVR